MKTVNVFYTSSSGNTYDLKAKGLVRLKTANFHKYEWSVDATQHQYGVAIDRFRREPAAYTAELVFESGRLENKDLIERLHADFERDILSNSPGTLTWGDYSIETFAISSSTEPGEREPEAKNTVKFYCPSPFWTKEIKTSIYPYMRTPRQTDKSYSYQYGYSYAETLDARALVDTKHYAESDFRMVAYGPFDCLNVRISGNVYRVDYAVNAGEIMVIDSRKNGVYKGQAYVLQLDGRKVDVFDHRSPLYQLFKKLPAGLLVIDYERTYGIDLSVFLERSEPVWS